jgi:hypothetical protein
LVAEGDWVRRIKRLATVRESAAAKFTAMTLKSGEVLRVAPLQEAAKLLSGVALCHGAADVVRYWE